MGMSNQERQKRDADPERRQKYLEKEKEKYKKDKERGLKKQVKDMTNREKRAARQRWRNQKRKQKELSNALNNNLTPPETPDAAQIPGPSRQRRQSMKKKNRDIAKCYRDNKVLKQHIEKLKRQSEMYKKRWMRQKKNDPETPRTKTRKLLRYYPKKEVKRTLLFHNILIEQIRKKYKSENKQETGRLARMLSGNVLRKYKFKTHALEVCQVTARIGKPKKNSLFHRLFHGVREVYTRDDNSRLMAGVKNTVTFKKKKKTEKNFE